MVGRVEGVNLGNLDDVFNMERIICHDGSFFAQ